jgi:hypothetical protein
MELVLTGYKEIDQVLRGLPLQLNHKIVGAAIAESSKPLVSVARQLAPKDTDKLANSIGSVKTPIGSATNLGEVKVGPRLRKGGYTGHWNEYGTKPRYTKGKGKYRKGAYRGKMTAKPFMLPAYMQTKDIVLAGIREQIGVKLYAFMRRTIKKVA